MQWCDPFLSAAQFENEVDYISQPSAPKTHASVPSDEQHPASRRDASSLHFQRQRENPGTQFV